MQFSEAVRNARGDAIETTIGASAILKIFDGALPANCAAVDSGNVLATVALPADWMANAAAGVKAKAGTWQDLSADANGVAVHFRIYDNGETACHIQGSVTATGNGGDMTLDNTTLAAGQEFTVNSFNITEGNA